MAKIDFTIEIAAPLALVFDRIVDHEAMAQWPGVNRCTLVKQGTPDRNGLGAVREVRAGGLTMQEEVVRFDRPNGYHYKIIQGLAVDHLGTVALTAVGDRTRVD